MNKAELIEKLKEIAEDQNNDTEKAHIDADDLLIEFIDDPDIEEAYSAIGKWYA